MTTIILHLIVSLRGQSVSKSALHINTNTFSNLMNDVVMEGVHILRWSLEMDLFCVSETLSNGFNESHLCRTHQVYTEIWSQTPRLLFLSSLSVSFCLFQRILHLYSEFNLYQTLCLYYAIFRFLILLQYGLHASKVKNTLRLL